MGGLLTVWVKGTYAQDEGSAVETYDYHLTKKGAEVWINDSQFRNGQTWRQHLMTLARIPAKAHGCDGVRLVGPDGHVLVEAGLGGDVESPPPPETYFAGQEASR